MRVVKQVRSVLAGAYRSKERTLLTHMVLLPEGDMSEGEAVCGRAKNLADGYALENPDAPPTCPRCLLSWNRRKED